MRIIFGICVIAVIVSACAPAGNHASYDKAFNGTNAIAAANENKGHSISIKTNRLGMEFVYIEPGVFIMGSPLDEKPRSILEAPHEVTLTQGFYMGRTEVTVGQFRKFVDATGYTTDAEKNDTAKRGCEVIIEANGLQEWDWKADTNWRSTGFKQDDTMPVACVSWDDTQAFIHWLNNETGRTYRLPTEAEWEYAARSGGRSARFWGDAPDSACSYANVADQDLCIWFAAAAGAHHPSAAGPQCAVLFHPGSGGSIWGFASYWKNNSSEGPVSFSGRVYAAQPYCSRCFILSIYLSE